MSASIELNGLCKAYGGEFAVRGVSLAIKAGEFFTLLGSSGSGKTTTLMMIAGFVEPDGGEILLGGKSIIELPPERRNLGVVFQNYALFPNMTVAQNIAFPLRMRRLDHTTMERKVAEALRLVDLKPYAERRIGQLSGGQQQRVALARALVFEPPVLLMDEPLGALDRTLREQLQGEIKNIHRRLGVTVIYVTHDQDEALVLSDRIAVMARGSIEQMGSPVEVYERPKSMFVGQFLGESNVIKGRAIACTGDHVSVALTNGAGTVEVIASAAAAGAAVQLLIRPEMISLAPRQPEGANAIRGRVHACDYLGSSVRYLVDTPAGAFTCRVPRGAADTRFDPGSELFVVWQPQDATVFLEGGAPHSE